jgi:hypothetical protein
LENQSTPLSVQGNLLVPDLAHQKHGFSWGFSQGQQKLVAAQVLFQGFPYLAFSPEEPVRWGHPVNSLVGSEVVVVGHEMPEPLLGFREVLGLDPFPEFFTYCCPKPFGFSHSLGMVGTSHHMLDAFPDQKPLEITLSPPGEILSPLVGQHLPGFPESFNAIQ